MIVPGAEAEVFARTMESKACFVIAARIARQFGSVNVLGRPPEFLGIREEFFFETGDQLTTEIPVGTIKRVLDKPRFEHLRRFAEVTRKAELLVCLWGESHVAVLTARPDHQRFFEAKTLRANLRFPDDIVKDTGDLPPQMPRGQQIAGDLGIDGQACPVRTPWGNLFPARLVFEEIRVSVLGDNPVELPGVRIKARAALGAWVEDGYVELRFDGLHGPVFVDPALVVTRHETTRDGGSEGFLGGLGRGDG